MESVITEMKNLPEELNMNSEQAEEKNIQLEDMSTVIIQPEKTKKE